jgi:hypothetical protein
MAFLKTSKDGELFLDHSASPGLPPGVAQRMDLPPELVGEGGRMHAATLGCPHCGGVVFLNPMRKRERANCFKCNAYICDGCAAVMRDPNYVHRTFAELAELVQSGKWAVSGPTCNPILTPTEK